MGESTSVWQNDAHIARLHGRPNIFPIQELAQQHDSRMLSKAEKYFPALLKQQSKMLTSAGDHCQSMVILCLGGSPARPDGYMAIMHSGVSLAPIVGQLVAPELIQQTSVVRLDEYRPTRYFEIVKRIS